MCSSTSSVGLTQDTGRSESSVGATATHELGHIMNMNHDDAGELGCMYSHSVHAHVCVWCMRAAYICIHKPFYLTLYIVAHVSSSSFCFITANCGCPDGQSRCIMAATITFTPPTRWSQCSVDDLNSGFNNRNLDRCLFNEPTTVVGDPICGNGIQEEGEACDCGSSQVCTRVCMNERNSVTIFMAVNGTPVFPSLL